MNIGSRIKELRLNKGYKSGEFADLIGVSSVFLSYIESGTKKPSYETLAKICQALNITLSEFFDEGTEPLALTPELKELVESAKNLTPSQLEALKITAKAFKEGR